MTLLTVKEVARMLNVSDAWVRDHAAGGGRRAPVIPCVRMGTTLRFRPESVEKFKRDMEQFSLDLEIRDDKH